MPPLPCRFPIQGPHLIAVLGGFAGEKFASRERERHVDGVALLERNLLISFRPSDFVAVGRGKKLFAVA